MLFLCDYPFLLLCSMDLFFTFYIIAFLILNFIFVFMYFTRCLLLGYSLIFLCVTFIRIKIQKSVPSLRVPLFAFSIAIILPQAVLTLPTSVIIDKFCLFLNFIYMESYSMYLFVCDFLYSTWYFWDSVLFSCISFYCCVVFCYTNIP